ncbi:MAG: hypothetical protein P8101_06440 [Candidatus Thiodiazotropha sp.]
MFVMIRQLPLTVLLLCYFMVNAYADYPANGKIIFETDFKNDGAYFDTGTSFIRHTDLPEGWDGIRTNQGTIRGVPGAGVNGSVALKFEWPSGGTALATSLFKHLTGDESTGYDEVFIRYRVRLPNNFQAGSPGLALPYWKWGRLWQNCGLDGAKWTENRTDSYFIVWNWGSGLPKWGIKNNIIMSENLATNNKGSAGSPAVGAKWYDGVAGDKKGTHIGVPGMWDNVGAGAIEFDHESGSDTRKLFDQSGQTWHTFEWRYKLSSTDTANDGVFQVWFDGIEQIPPLPVSTPAQSIDRPMDRNSLMTAAKPGFNLFTLFDNISGWNRHWNDTGIEGGIYINDVVISTSRIGHNYNVGQAPKPPSDFSVH